MEDVIPLPNTQSSFRHRGGLSTPVKIPDTCVTQVPITNLAISPRNSRSSFTVPDMGKSLRSLHGFKDLFVSRKRIAIGQVLGEGTELHHLNV